MAYILEVQYFNSFVIKGPSDAYHIEESRIRGGFNDQSVDLGVRAHTTDNNYSLETRESSMIHSGIYNSRTRVNNLNSFSVAEDISTSVDIINGSIQFLFAEDTNLNIFQEEKVSYSLIDKDVIYTAEGGRITTQSDRVFGEIQSYAGSYGIGKNPESFAYFAGRKYFADKPKGLFMRLSRDGMTEISNYGMRSFTRDNIQDATIIQGAFDMYEKRYVVSVNRPANSFTMSFDEGVKGWVSFYDFVTDEGMASIDTKFFSFKQGDVWRHYMNTNNANFYGVQYEPYVDIILNTDVSGDKNFLSLTYEGDPVWKATNISTDQDTAYDVAEFDIANQDVIISGFKKHNNKLHANIINNSSAKPNEVLFGADVAGIKGYYLKTRLTSTDTDGIKTLFSVSSRYNTNHY